MQDERLRLETVAFVRLEVDEHRPREQRVVRVRGHDAHADAVRRVGAGPRVDHVERAGVASRRVTFSRSPSKCSSESAVLTSPHQIRSSDAGSRTMNLSFGSPGVKAGVDHEPPTLGQPPVAARQRVRVEQLRRRIRIDAAGRVDPVLGETHPAWQLRGRHGREAYGTTFGRF